MVDLDDSLIDSLEFSAIESLLLLSADEISAGTLTMFVVPNRLLLASMFP